MRLPNGAIFDYFLVFRGTNPTRASRNVSSLSDLSSLCPTKTMSGTILMWSNVAEDMKTAYHNGISIMLWKENELFTYLGKF